jgi:hypothetical protein
LALKGLKAWQKKKKNDGVYKARHHVRNCFDRFHLFMCFHESI